MLGNGQWKLLTPPVELLEEALTVLPVQVFQSRAATATVRTTATTASAFVSLYMCRAECCENLIYKM